MKFYDYTFSVNTRRVRIFMAEKGIEIPTVEIDFMNAEQLGKAFRKINPLCTIPVLETDEGINLVQVPAIVLYLEEQYPDTPLLGTTTLQRALIREWMHRIFIDCTIPLMEIFRNTNKMFTNRALPGPIDLAQIPELAGRGIKRLMPFFNDVDAHVRENEFVVGDQFTMADIDLLTCMDFAKMAKQEIPTHCKNLLAWRKKVSQRPSAKA